MSVMFSDIKAMIAARPALPPEKADDQTRCHSEALSLICRLQQSCHPGFKHPRAAFYASVYTLGDKRPTQETLDAIAEGRHVAQQFCTRLNADLRVYELDMETALRPDGLEEKAAAHLIAYGLMAVEEHVDCLILGSLSHGFDQALTVIEKSIDAENDIFALLAHHGGHDLCALTGAILSARMASIPVIAAGRTAVILKKIAVKLLGEGDDTLIVAENTGGTDDVAALHAAYRMVGDMLVMECGSPSSVCASKNCAA